MLQKYLKYKYKYKSLKQVMENTTNQWVYKESSPQPVVNVSNKIIAKKNPIKDIQDIIVDTPWIKFNNETNSLITTHIKTSQTNGSQTEKLIVDSKVANIKPGPDEKIYIYFMNNYHGFMITNTKSYFIKKKIFVYVYPQLPNITLSGVYLDKYNNFMASKNTHTLLLDNNFYMYEYKLKQHLSSHGLNRTTQKLGTCWMNTIVNSILLGVNLRGEFVKMLLSYINKTGGMNKFKLTIKKYDQPRYKIASGIDSNYNVMCLKIITLLYKVLCDTGLRNSSPEVYDNYLLTNNAINIKYMTNPTAKIEPNNLSSYPGWV